MHVVFYRFRLLADGALSVIPNFEAMEVAAERDVARSELNEDAAASSGEGREGVERDFRGDVVPDGVVRAAWFGWDGDGRKVFRNVFAGGRE